jgi:Spy/CpxP family protein refolding chaperone
MGFETYSFAAGPENREVNLDPTPEQIQTLKDLKIQFHREQSQIRKKIMIKRMEARTLTPDEFNGEKGDEIRNQIQSLMLQARERSLFYREEAYRVYTPEQRKKISPDTDLGFHCRGWFRRGGRWGSGTESEGSGPVHFH